MNKQDKDYAVFIDDEDEIEQLSIWCSKEQAVEIYRNSQDSWYQLVILKRVNVDD